MEHIVFTDNIVSLFDCLYGIFTDFNIYRCVNLLSIHFYYTYRKLTLLYVAVWNKAALMFYCSFYSKWIDFYQKTDMKVPIETCNIVSVIWINKKLDVRLLETSTSISGETNRKQGSMLYSACLLSVPSLSPSELHFPLHSVSAEVDWWSPTLSPLDQAPPSVLPAVMPSPSLPANKTTHSTVCSLPYVSVNMKSAALLIRQNPAFTSILICNTKDVFMHDRWWCTDVDEDD